MFRARFHRSTATLITACALLSPCSMAFAQSGAPSLADLHAPWTTDAQAPQWGETPATVRMLLVKLQTMSNRAGPDAFDVVWLRELLRQPGLYHLSDSDQAWMHRTILAADQAHANHWQPAMPAVAAVPASASTVETSKPVPPFVVPVVSAEPIKDTQALTRTVEASTRSAAKHEPTVVVKAPSSPPTVNASVDEKASPGSSTPWSLLFSSTTWAMIFAALLICSIAGLCLSRSKPSGPKLPTKV